ncbi:MAG: acyloxyacyl hydrolase [Tepidisphaeraceae bacterium]|jgi:hypothetical protein
MKNRIVVLPAVCALALLFSQSALAQESPATSPSFVSLVPDTPAAELFPREDRTLDITGQYVAQVTDHRRDQLWGGSIGGSYYLFDRTAVVAQIPFYNADQTGGARSFAGGITLLARYHFLEIGRLSLFADGGAGALLADNRVPPDGTNFNFTPQVGLGLTWRINDRLDLIGGSRFFHLSNAGIDGDKNPSINGAIEGYAGLMWRF